MYPSTSDLVSASTVTALTGLAPDQQDGLRAAAISAVESHCGQQFTALGSIGSPVTRRIDGSGNPTLYLPVRLAEFVSIRTVGTSSGLTVDQVQLSDDRGRLTIKTGGGSTWLGRVAAGETVGGGVFPAGVDNIEVAGIWGWTDIEYAGQLAAVTTAIRFDMEDKALAGAHDLADTVRASRALGLDSVRQGRISLDLGVEPDLSVRARRQLAGLVFNHAAGATA